MLPRHHRTVGDYLQERLYHTEVESLLANGSGQKFISRDYHTTGADLHYSLKTLCRRNFYVAFG